MVKLITGGKGTGKTKKMIEMANNLIDTEEGNIVFVDDNKRSMYDLKHKVRFISLDEYPVKNIDSFLGFLCGIISRDHDIETIFIDGLLKMKNIELNHLIPFTKEIKDLSEKFEINFVMSISCDLDKLPEELRAYDIL
ncbi:twitching motility protein PilT [Crassaminicella profunda]|uniref:twitching motility protein PilT n=1 Tax=Crassaminicella profunda TaxID=1286698 RepID=UPI001CA75FE1|nr:twitching motility protein PilT [Crassaminicella profunda]QZY53756.1 twitching motility protein PilT [Crassaminicella profunda]